MKGQEPTFEEIIESRFPGLVAGIRATIQDSERAYEGNGCRAESHLWEHTAHVASIVLQLAQAERLDPLLPSIAALFHDIGKFVGGVYRSDEIIEEEESARIAEQMLREAGMKKTDIRRVVSGLRALYNEKAGGNKLAALIHDADFLAKFGAMGVASFFTKSVLRGRALRSSIIGYLSKELTYAACLPMNMRTAAGKLAAVKKTADSVRFFRSLLTELRKSGLANLKIRKMTIPGPSGKKPLNIQLVASPVCPKCDRAWQMAWSTENGVKCTKLNVEWNCAKCGESVGTSFCLPEIA
ncbi:MAG TPA: HD domain-containing protein [Acidobacteriota bacterium]|nr:HD domain-containing protein [Acidobacteriota bacterium]